MCTYIVIESKYITLTDSLFLARTDICIQIADRYLFPHLNFELSIQMIKIWLYLAEIDLQFSLIILIFSKTFFCPLLFWQFDNDRQCNRSHDHVVLKSIFIIHLKNDDHIMFKSIDDFIISDHVPVLWILNPFFGLR